jgi:hypothetical protein
MSDLGRYILKVYMPLSHSRWEINWNQEIVVVASDASVFSGLDQARLYL